MSDEKKRTFLCADSGGYEVAAITQHQRKALKALQFAAINLVNAKISADLCGTGFDAALKAGRASIQITIDLPSGEVACVAHYPAMSDEPLPLFDVQLSSVDPVVPS